MDFETTAFVVIKCAYETYINVLMVLSCFLKGLKKRQHSCLFGLCDGCFNNDLIHGHRNSKCATERQSVSRSSFSNPPLTFFFYYVCLAHISPLALTEKRSETETGGGKAKKCGETVYNMQF